MTTEERLEKVERALAELRAILSAVSRALTSKDGVKLPERDREDFRIQDPDHPESLTFTSFDKGQFGTEIVHKWNDLLRVAIRVAVQKGHGITDLRQWTDVRVREGSWTTEGYTPIPGTKVSVGGMCANDAWKNAFALARALKCEIRVDFHWRKKGIYPNERGRLLWSPESEAGGRPATPVYPGRPGPSDRGRQGLNPQGPR